MTVCKQNPAGLIFRIASEIVRQKRHYTGIFFFEIPAFIEKVSLFKSILAARFSLDAANAVYPALQFADGSGFPGKLEHLTINEQIAGVLIGQLLEAFNG
jgi:hypothetical protein